MPISYRTLAALGLALALAAPTTLTTPASAGAPAAPQYLTMASGLKCADSVPGTGAYPKKGQTCVVHYTGWLYENGAKGRKFDSSHDRGEPIAFSAGTGEVIKGWDDGVFTMRAGGKRTLIIPPALAYGEAGAAGLVPPNATLIFDVELLSVK